MSSLEIDLPETFKKNILSCFGNKGTQWLKNLDTMINSCIQRWNLSECKSVKDLSFNYVCTAKSADYGDVVLKIAVSGDEINTEQKALGLYNKTYICTCHDYYPDLHALLLERIVPGHNLYSLPRYSQHISTAAGIITDLPVMVNRPADFPSYKDWLDKAFVRARKDPEIPKEILDYIHMAGDYFADINNLPMPHMLLHGDFHHQNILQAGNNRWKVIDPKGVTGVLPLEAGRFIRNQLWVMDRKKHKSVLQQMVRAFAGAMDVEENIIIQCAFIDCILSNCWTLEGFLTTKEFNQEITNTIDEADLFLGSINQ